MVAGNLRTKCSDGEARTFASRHPIRRHLRRERPARPQPSARTAMQPHLQRQDPWTGWGARLHRTFLDLSSTSNEHPVLCI